MGLALLLAILLASAPALGQLSFEQEPINYRKAAPNDPISRLQQKIDAGSVKLQYDTRHGYLKSALDQLDVPASAQMLVFSKTSFQLKRISPRTPRAIYFGDDVYVGWVQGADVMEFSTVDPKLGANFYTLGQQVSDKPQFRRHTDNCLQCHGSTLTHGVPGHLVRSVYAGADGQPNFAFGTHLTDHASPLEKRWGGWYVTGKHGAQRHLGNLFVGAADDPDHLDTGWGANVVDLSRLFDTTPYLTPHSDIVALMVLEHQTKMHNLITRANFLTRIALRDERVINQMLERPASHRSESTRHRIERAAEPVVQYMLMSGATPLTGPIQGTTPFAQEFAARGPYDKQGRSLRQLDLTSRLFTYPCSYLIYSPSIGQLPQPVKDRIYQRLWQVLSGQDQSKEFQHLTTADRQATLQILRETKQDLPSYWN